MKYIHVDPNHPPSTIKHIPKPIIARISSLRPSKEILHEAAQHYEQNLASCECKEKLNYKEQSKSKRKQKTVKET